MSLERRSTLLLPDPTASVIPQLARETFTASKKSLCAMLHYSTSMLCAYVGCDAEEKSPRIDPYNTLKACNFQTNDLSDACKD